MIVPSHGYLVETETGEVVDRDVVIDYCNNYTRRDAREHRLPILNSAYYYRVVTRLKKIDAHVMRVARALHVSDKSAIQHVCSVVVKMHHKPGTPTMVNVMCAWYLELRTRKPVSSLEFTNQMRKAHLPVYCQSNNIGIMDILHSIRAQFGSFVDWRPGAIAMRLDGERLCDISRAVQRSQATLHNYFERLLI
jgi:hypothetical protein